MLKNLLLWLYLANSQVSVYRTIGPLVFFLFFFFFFLNDAKIYNNTHTKCLMLIRNELSRKSRAVSNCIDPNVDLFAISEHMKENCHIQSICSENIGRK